MTQRRFERNENDPTLLVPSTDMSAKKLLVDIHTHVYLPRYVSVLRSRSAVPFIRTDTSTQQDRLLILDHEPSGGRPGGPQYWDRAGTNSSPPMNRCRFLIKLFSIAKLQFMDKHGIDVSVVRYSLFKKRLFKEMPNDPAQFCEPVA